VWLGLCSPDAIRHLDAQVVGSRELRQQSRDWNSRLYENADDLPPAIGSFCRRLAMSVGSKDGFRRQAVPLVVYRYFADLRGVFLGLTRILNPGALLAFVVGPNQTTLGGQHFIIDTPSFLALIATELGFKVREIIPLQTYQRYGLHQKNSIRGEDLTIMEWQKRRLMFSTQE
jgi:site-specific DNA-methyltransferase (cytosine-N4-specific)